MELGTLVLCTIYHNYLWHGVHLFEGLSVIITPLPPARQHFGLVVTPVHKMNIKNLEPIITEVLMSQEIQRYVMLGSVKDTIVQSYFDNGQKRHRAHEWLESFEGHQRTVLAS